MLRWSAAVCVSLLSSIVAQAEEPAWPSFRGPNCSGISSTSNPPVQFGKEKNVVWKVAVPSGASCPIVSGDRIFLTAFEDGKLETICLSTVDGKELWKKTAPAKEIETYHVTLGSPAASSVATDGKYVVSYFGSCGLTCFDIDGNVLWSKPMPCAQTHGDFGSGTSPVIVDGNVILVRDVINQPEMYAFNLKTGKEAWKVPRNEFLSSYSTPVVWENSNRKELVVSGSYCLKSYDPQSGKELWSVRGLPSVVCTSPVVQGDVLCYAGWSPPAQGEGALPSFAQLLAMVDKNKDGQFSKDESVGTELETFFGGQDLNKDGVVTLEEWDTLKVMMEKGVNRVFAVKAGGAGDVTDSHVLWSQEKAVTLPYVPSPIIFEDELFLIKDGGQVSVLDPKTGEGIVQRKRLGDASPYFASPVAANGHLYVTSLSGKISVLTLKPELQEIETIELGETTAATPALVGDRIYVRTQSTLYAFGK